MKADVAIVVVLGLALVAALVAAVREPEPIEGGVAPIAVRYAVHSAVK